MHTWGSYKTPTGAKLLIQLLRSTTDLTACILINADTVWGLYIARKNDIRLGFTSSVPSILCEALHNGQVISDGVSSPLPSGAAASLLLHFDVPRHQRFAALQLPLTALAQADFSTTT